MREGGFCAILIQAARKSLILNGEMSEWSIEHAWKAIPATLNERHQSTSAHNRFSDLRPADERSCDAVNLGIRRWFPAHLTQFLHSSRFHFALCIPLCVGTRSQQCTGPDQAMHPSSGKQLADP
jgi:hypothetical protein